MKEMINRGAKGAFSATLNPLPDENALGRIASGTELEEFEAEGVVNG